MNKEIEDALHTLLHCSLKDTEYETQVEQYKIVRNYITNLQQENKKLNGAIQTYDILLKANAEENKQLKEKYENAVADYETTMFEKEQSNSLVNSCQEEIRQLKKQVEEYKEQVNKGLYNTCLPYTTGYNKAIKDKEAQQKEFINYLEEEINNTTSRKEQLRNKKAILVLEIRNSNYNSILQKYKSIIGGKE